jgi:hypothetical protein
MQRSTALLETIRARPLHLSKKGGVYLRAAFPSVPVGIVVTLAPWLAA